MIQIKDKSQHIDPDSQVQRNDEATLVSMRESVSVHY